LARVPISGSTLKALAIVAGLFLARGFETQIESVLLVSREGGLRSWFYDVLVDSSFIAIMAIPMFAIIIWAANRGPRQGGKRVAALTAAVIVGSGAFVLMRVLVASVKDGAIDWSFVLGFSRSVWPRYAIIAGMLTLVVELYRRERMSTAAAQQAELDSAALDREWMAARLQVLQAQIEPHFLFNTLANVRRLYEEDRAAGRTMLDKVMRYLAVALPRVRHGEPLLAHEFELVEAYLHIQRIRMGHRLSFTMDVAPGLARHPVPPMLLLTLVENAIKHGLNALPDGGRVRVTAHAERDRLLLTVADTGVGFSSASGSGLGLANVSARLAAQFGDSASLVLGNNELGGATATIALPLVRTAVLR
jgi:signal transduction histidine kinase